LRFTRSWTLADWGVFVIRVIGILGLCLSGIHDDPLVDFAHDVFAKPFAKVGHEKMVKRLVLLESGQTDEELQIRVFRDLLYRVTVTQSKALLDDECSCATRTDTVRWPLNDRLNCLLYSSSTCCHGMRLASLTQRFSLISLPPKGKKKSSGRMSWFSIL